MPALSIEVDTASPLTTAFGTPTRSVRSNSRPSMLKVQEEEEQEEAPDRGCSDEDDDERQEKLQDKEREDSAAEQAEEWLRSHGLDTAAIQSVRSRFHESDIAFDVKSLQGLAFDELWQCAKSAYRLPINSSKRMEREGQGAHSVLVNDCGEEASDDEDVELFQSPPQVVPARPHRMVTSVQDRDDPDDDLDTQRADEHLHPQIEMSFHTPSSPRRQQHASTGVVQRGQPNLQRTLSPMEEYAASLRARESTESATIQDNQPDADAGRSAEVSVGASTGRKGKSGGSRRWTRLSGRGGNESNRSQSDTVVPTGDTQEDDEDAAARAEAAALRARLLAERGLQRSVATASSIGHEGTRLSTAQRSVASVKQPPPVPAEARVALLSTPQPRRSRSSSSGASRTIATPPLPSRDEEDELEHQREGEEASDDVALLVSQYFERYDVDLDGRLSSPTELGAALNSAYPALSLEAAELEELRQEAQAEVSAETSETSESHAEGLSLAQFEFLIAGFATEMGPPKPLERLSRTSRGAVSRVRQTDIASESWRAGQRHTSTTVKNGFNI